MADLRTVLRIIAKDETKGAISKTQQELRGLGNSLTALRNQALALAGINFGIGGLAQLTALADGYALTTSRLRLLSGETENFTAVQKEVFQIAQDTFTTYEQTASIYGNLAASTQEVGLQSEDLLTITKALNQSYKISGSTQQEATASTIQLVQALASGQIRGQEFNSVAEQGRRILFALKDATGLTAGELRQFANEGKLTTKFFVDNFLPQAQKINEEFETIPITVGRSLTQLQNAFQQYVGQQNEALGITASVADVFSNLAENFDDFAEGLVSVAAVALTVINAQFFASLTKAVAARVALAQASIQQTKADAVAVSSTVARRKAELDLAAAEQARVVRLQATLRQEAVTEATRQELLAKRVFLYGQVQAAAARTAAAEAALATAVANTGAQAARASVGVRLLGAAWATVGGIPGLIATGATLGVLYWLSQTGEEAETASESLTRLKESLSAANAEAKAAAEGLSGAATEMQRLENATQFTQLEEAERAIKRFNEEIAENERRLEALKKVQRNTNFRSRRIISLEEDLGQLREELKEAEELRDGIKGNLEELLDLDDESRQGVPEFLKNVIKNQEDANEALKTVEKDRRKIVESLRELQQELSGPAQIDIGKLSSSANILGLNTLRSQITESIEKGDATEAVRRLGQAKAIIDELAKSGEVSRGYLKAQVDLLAELGEEAGDIDLAQPEPISIDIKLNRVAYEKEIKDFQAGANKLLELAGIDARVNLKPDITGYRALQDELLRQNPGKAVINYDTPETLSTVDTALQSSQNELDAKGPLTGFIEWVSGPQAGVKKTIEVETPTQLATGGYVQGPGGPTSDSILSWLSNGEFVVRAAAVKHYGPEILAKLNAMRLPKFAGGGAVTHHHSRERLLERLQMVTPPRYSAGGLVVKHLSTLPRFAAGGAVNVPSVPPRAGATNGAPIIFNVGNNQYEATIIGGNVGDLRTALRREQMKRGSRV